MGSVGKLTKYCQMTPKHVPKVAKKLRKNVFRFLKEANTPYVLHCRTYFMFLFFFFFFLFLSFSLFIVFSFLIFLKFINNLRNTFRFFKYTVLAFQELLKECSDKICLFKEDTIEFSFFLSFFFSFSFSFSFFLFFFFSFCIILFCNNKYIYFLKVIKEIIAFSRT